VLHRPKYFRWKRRAARRPHATLRQDYPLDEVSSQVNNRPVAANSATGFSGPKYTAHTAPHRTPAFFYARNSCGVVCRFLAAVCGEPRGSPVSVSGPLTRTPFATLYSPFRVATPRKGSCPWIFGMRSATPAPRPVALSALSALFLRR
jgi:hypothetical protein